MRIYAATNQSPIKGTGFGVRGRQEILSNDHELVLRREAVMVIRTDRFVQVEMKDGTAIGRAVLHFD